MRKGIAFDKPERRRYAKGLHSDTTAHIMSYQAQRETKPELLNPVILTVLYALLLTYGTLYPLTGWSAPDDSPWSLLLGARGRYASRSDILTNILVYIPLGLLLAQGFVRRTFRWSALALAAGLGASLSIALELLQAYLPSRVPSILDVAFNTSGALIGASVSLALSPEATHGRWLRTRLREYLAPGRLPLVGLFTVLLWAASQLTPFVLSLDVGNLRAGLRPIWCALHGTIHLDSFEVLVYALNLAGLGLLAATIWRSSTDRLWVFAGFVATTLVLKVPVLTRQLSLEALAGASLGLLAVWFFDNRKSQYTGAIAALFLIAGLIAAALLPTSPPLQDIASINWALFRNHLSNNLIGLADIAASTWPFFGLSYLALLSKPTLALPACLGGGFGVFALALALEWLQQPVSGGPPDVTDALLAVIAWTLPWLYPGLRITTKEPTDGGAKGLAHRSKVRTPSRPADC